jgi:hypothetical protein
LRLPVIPPLSPARQSPMKRPAPSPRRLVRWSASARAYISALALIWINCEHHLIGHHRKRGQTLHTTRDRGNDGSGPCLRLHDLQHRLAAHDVDQQHEAVPEQPAATPAPEPAQHRSQTGLNEWATQKWRDVALRSSRPLVAQQLFDSSVSRTGGRLPARGKIQQARTHWHMAGTKDCCSP